MCFFAVLLRRRERLLSCRGLHPAVEQSHDHLRLVRRGPALEDVHGQLRLDHPPHDRRQVQGDAKHRSGLVILPFFLAAIPKKLNRFAKTINKLQFVNMSSFSVQWP